LSQHLPAPSSVPIQAWARWAGILYLIVIAIGLYGEAGIRNALIVPGDSVATAHNILAAEFLWRLGVAGQYLLLLCAVGLTMAWYVLLRPVNRNLALLLVFFALVSLAVESVSALHLQAVLAPLSGAAYLHTADPQQAYAAAYLSVVAHAGAFGLALVFFGVECLIAGYLIRRSGFFPAAIGWLMQLAGLCYLLNSFAMVLFPPLHARLFPAILVPSFIGESAFCLWLLIRGVDADAWRQRAQGDVSRAS
jgi:Domain of unknown function (DUF4386)